MSPECVPGTRNSIPGQDQTENRNSLGLLDMFELFTSGLYVVSGTDFNKRLNFIQKIPE